MRDRSRMRAPLRLRTLLSVALVALLPLSCGEGAYAEPTRQERIHAALMLKFLKYVSQPSGAKSKKTDPIVVGVLASNSQYTALRRLAGKTVKGRKIVVRRLTAKTTSHADLSALYVGRNWEARAKPLLKLSATSPLLVVGESRDVIKAGGVISFFRVKIRVKFEINLENLTKRKLTVSPRLLKAASERDDAK